MRTVLINQNGYVSSPYINDADQEIEISDEQFEMMLVIPFNHNWRYVNGDFILEPLMTDQALRERRERECFRIVDNRSMLWYNRLTQEQKDELNTWYQAWLDVTKTKVIPTVPEWLV